MGLLVTIDFWSSVTLAAAPMLLAMTGIALCGRAGIVHFGAEGLFMVGALAAFMLSDLGTDPWTSFVAAGALGATLGLIHGSLALRLNQTLTGLGLSMLLAAASQSIFVLRFGAPSSLPIKRPFEPFGPIGLFDFIPGLGAWTQALQLSPPIGIALACVLVVGYVLNRTPLGLTIRACGEAPAAVAAQGRPVAILQLVANAAGSMLIGFGGAALSLALVSSFSPGLVNWRGFIALALATAVGWRLRWIVIAAIAFAIIDTLEWRLQAGDNPPAGPWLALMPLVFALMAIAALGARGSWLRLYRSGRGAARTKAEADQRGR